MQRVTNQRRARQRGTGTSMVRYHSTARCQPPDDRFFDARADGFCPVCGNHSRFDGETVDVGVGCIPVTPDHCDVCAYSTPGYRDSYALVEFVQKCWELQIAPYGDSMWLPGESWFTALKERLGEPDEVVDGNTDVWYFDAEGSDRAVFVSHRTGTPSVRVWQSNWNGVEVKSGEQLDALLLGLRVIMPDKAAAAAQTELLPR